MQRTYAALASSTSPGGPIQTPTSRRLRLQPKSGAGSQSVEYVGRVSRISHLARRCWFDGLIALLAIVAILDVVLGRGTPGAPTTTLWFCIPALVILVLPVFARQRFPFAGPALYWLLAAGISFVDPLLIPFPGALVPIG